MSEKPKKPEFDLICSEGYPTDEFISFLNEWTYESPYSIGDVLDMVEQTWEYRSIGFKRRQKRNGIQTIEMHTIGWSGNEEIIGAIISNPWLTRFKLQYFKWITGGHYYFKLKL